MSEEHTGEGDYEEMYEEDVVVESDSFNDDDISLRRVIELIGVDMGNLSIIELYPVLPRVLAKFIGCNVWVNSPFLKLRKIDSTFEAKFSRGDRSQYLGEALLSHFFEKIRIDPCYLDDKNMFKSAPFLFKCFSSEQCDQERANLDQLIGESEGAYKDYIQNAYFRFNKNIEKTREFLRSGTIKKGDLDTFDFQQEISCYKYTDQRLIKIICSVYDIFLNITNVCYLCGAKHLNPGYRPSVCDRKECQVRMINFRANTDLIGYIKNRKMIADFLISFASVAHGTKFFEPKPPDVSDQELSEFFQEVPSIEEICSSPDENSIFQHISDESKKKTFLNILSYIVLCCRSELIYLRKDMLNIELNKESHVFYSQISNSKKETNFRSLRSKPGMSRKFLWHGTPAERFHTILHHGLKNLSGTRLQKNGAAYGHGIYFAPDSTTSFCYMETYSNKYRKSILGSSISVIIIAEVLSDKFKVESSGYCYVIKEEERVNFRFLIVNPKEFSINLDKVELKFDEDKIVDDYLREMEF